MNVILSKLKAVTKTDIAAMLLLSAAFIYLFVISYFEGTISDEAFYITIPYRLMNGDGLFTDEWHLSQLSSVLLYLPVKLFTAFTGSMEGIILFMRHLFCIMQLTVGTFIYKTFRKTGLPSVIMSLSFVLFSVIGLNTLSYNTMGLALLYIVICISYSLYEKPSYIKMLALGSFIAMFILCQPVGLIFYGCYFIAFCILFSKAQKSDNAVFFPFRIKSFVMTVLGILPVLIFFLYLLLKNSDIATIIECIPGILSDVEHMEITEGTGIETFSLLQFFTDMTMSAGLVPLVIFIVCALLSVIIKKKNRELSVILTLTSLAVFILCFFYRLFFTGGTSETDDINFFFFPLALSGVVFYLLSDKKNHRVFILLWCTGIMYALLMTISSNLRLHASVNGYIIAAAGSLILAKNLSDELKAQKTKGIPVKAGIILLSVCVSGFAVFHAGATVTNNILNRAHYQDARLEQGIYKGITLPSDQALALLRIYRDARQINDLINEDDKVFVVENTPSAYLEGEFNMGCISGWFIADQLGVPEIRDRFREYYEINPENTPDYIYVPSYTYTEDGIKECPPKRLAEIAYFLFEGEEIDLKNGVLIKVTGIKNEQT